MKALAELNALLLQAKNYERLKEIHVVEPDEDNVEESGVIVVACIPKPFISHLTKKFFELVQAEQAKAFEMVEQAAQKYVEASIK